MKAIREAQREQQTISTTNKSQTQLFPLYAIEPYLKSEKVVALSQTTVNDIHNCMLLLLSPPDMPEASSSTPPCTAAVHAKVFFETYGEDTSAQAAEPGCAACGNPYYITDYKFGHTTCTKCGAVRHGIMINHCFQKEETTHYDGRAPRVSEWTINSTMTSQEWKRHVLVDHMKHWNTYVHLGADDFQKALNLVCSIEQKRRIKAKCLAALLYVKNHENIHAWMQAKVGVIALRAQPAAYGTCPNCNAEFFTMKDKRFHHKHCVS